MLSIGTITAGDGYQYLTKEVASGVEDYYMRGGTEPGEAQGWWLGAQREDFGVTDRLVSEQQMAGFFGAKCDPVTGERLGSRFRVYATVEERLARARDEHERWVAEDLATRAAALRAAGERPEREAESLAAHMEAARERWEKTEQKIVRAGERNSVAGYDLTFSAPKSVSVLWASAPDRPAQDRVRAAHHEGVKAAMSLLEADGSFIRRGRNGVRQEKVSGVMAAAFDHRTSRTGDPQMHTHVAVLGMVKDAAGEVRGLDSRTVFRMSGALSAVYDFYRDKALVRDLNVRLDAREDTGVREVAGVPDSLRRLWSSRRAQITPKVEELKQAYRDAHGHEPPKALVAKMAQWATLDTRPEKREPESTEELFARWRATAKASEDTDLAEVWNRATARKWQAPKSEQTETEIVAAVTARLTKERSSWTVPNVTQLVYQCMDRDPRRSDAEDGARAQRCVNAVLCHDDVLRLTPVVELGSARRTGPPGRRAGVCPSQLAAVRGQLGAARRAVPGGPLPVGHQLGHRPGDRRRLPGHRGRRRARPERRSSPGGARCAVLGRGRERDRGAGGHRQNHHHAGVDQGVASQRGQRDRAGAVADGGLGAGGRHRRAGREHRQAAVRDRAPPARSVPPPRRQVDAPAGTAGDHGRGRHDRPQVHGGGDPVVPAGRGQTGPGRRSRPTGIPRGQRFHAAHGQPCGHLRAGPGPSLRRAVGTRRVAAAPSRGPGRARGLRGPGPDLRRHPGARTSSGPCASPWPTIWPAGGCSSWPAPTSGPPG